MHAQYGDRLVCVRYRFDRQRGKRYKTVEIIVEERDWIGRPEAPQWSEAFVRVGLAESKLQAQIREAGGRWDKARRLWRVPLDRVLELRVADRLVELIS